MNTYEYKAVIQAVKDPTSEEMTDAINAGAAGGWQFLTIATQKDTFYIIYQKLVNQIV